MTEEMARRSFIQDYTSTIRKNQALMILTIIVALGCITFAVLGSFWPLRLTVLVVAGLSIPFFKELRYDNWFYAGQRTGLEERQ